MTAPQAQVPAPIPPETRVRFHVASMSVDEDIPRLLDGMFGYSQQKVADKEVAEYNADEAHRAGMELRPVREVFFVARSTMTFDVVAPVQPEDES